MNEQNISAFSSKVINKKTSAEILLSREMQKPYKYDELTTDSRSA